MNTKSSTITAGDFLCLNRLNEFLGPRMEQYEARVLANGFESLEWLPTGKRAEVNSALCYTVSDGTWASICAQSVQHPALIRLECSCGDRHCYYRKALQEKAERDAFLTTPAENTLAYVNAGDKTVTVRGEVEAALLAQIAELQAEIEGLASKRAKLFQMVELWSIQAQAKKASLSYRWQPAALARADGHLGAFKAVLALMKGGQ
jgi:hypothetical protein